MVTGVKGRLGEERNGQSRGKQGGLEAVTDTDEGSLMTVIWVTAGIL